MILKHAIAVSAFFLSAAVSAQAANESNSYRVKNTLCSEPGYAIELAAARGAGQGQEIALDAVGKRAGKAVCAFYSGRAVIAEQKTVTKDGIFYKLTEWRFVQDGSVGWVAESAFTPERGAGTF